MPILVKNRSTELNALLNDTATDLSLPLKFGLGAGLYFEYFQRPHKVPSRRMTGLNRNLAATLVARVGQYQPGNVQILREALQENALLFNLDRTPTTALMGMEMLAEHMTDFVGLADWQSCVSEMRAEIIETGALYRRLYLQFMQEISPHIDLNAACIELSEIADEWEAFAAQLAETIEDAALLERAGRMLRRLAFREEHFWGNILKAASGDQ